MTGQPAERRSLGHWYGSTGGRGVRDRGQGRGGGGGGEKEGGEAGHPDISRSRLEPTVLVDCARNTNICLTVSRWR